VRSIFLAVFTKKIDMGRQQITHLFYVLNSSSPIPIFGELAVHAIPAHIQKLVKERLSDRLPPMGYIPRLFLIAHPAS